MKRHLNYLIILVITGLFFTSCEKLYEETPAGEQDDYLESFEMVSIISQIEIDAVYEYLASLYSDASDIGEKAVSSVKVYKITYKTTFQDEEVTASGLVSIPIGTETYPLLSFQNGTNTVHENAPTVASSDSEMGQLYKFIETVASTGFVIVLPDYIGFGSSSDLFHPYLDKESTVQSCIDMLFATKELMASHNLNVSISDDLYITGYSMGGWATLQLQKEIETNYSSDFNLKASACSGGPYNLLYMNNYIQNLEHYPMPYFIGYMLHSYINLGDITNEYSEIIKEPYASRIPDLYDGEHGGEQINGQLTTSVEELFTNAYRNGYASYEEFFSVRQTLLNNSIEAWGITTPLALIHGEADDFIPPEVSGNIYNDFLTLGVDANLIQFVLFPGIGHQDGIIPSGVSAINWFLQIKDSD